MRLSRGLTIVGMAGAAALLLGAGTPAGSVGVTGSKVGTRSSATIRAVYAVAAASAGQPAFYPLPSDGWVPGEISLSALHWGTLHASVSSSGQACAWLGTDSVPMLWPVGYRVRAGSLELLSASGRTVGSPGEMLDVGGGLETVTKPTPCVKVGQSVFVVQSAPSAVSSSPLPR